MNGVEFLFISLLSCAIAQQFNPGFQQQQGQWGQQSQNVNGLNSQRLPGNRPFRGQGQFPFQGSSGNNQGQNSLNQFGGNQQPAQNGQLQQGQFTPQGQNSFNLQNGGSQQGFGSASSNNANQGSTNINQILWNSYQNDYQCVINNCRGQNQQWNPVCGTDNLVYDNVAILRCAQQCGRRISFSYAGTCVVTTTPASRK